MHEILNFWPVTFKVITENHWSDYTSINFAFACGCEVRFNHFKRYHDPWWCRGHANWTMYANINTKLYI